MRELEDLLSRVDVSAVSSSKYSAVLDWLAQRTSLPRTELRCKAIQSGKNARNRLREAATAPMTVLLLLVDPAIDAEEILGHLHELASPQGPIRAVLVRSTTPSLRYSLVTEDDDLAAMLEETLPGIVRVPAATRTPSPLPVPHVGWCRSPISVPPAIIGAADGSSATSLQVFRDWVSDQSRVQREHVVVKAVTDLKNAGNRISEALGLHPAILVLCIPDPLLRPRVLEIAARRVSTSFQPPTLALLMRDTANRWTYEFIERGRTSMASRASEPRSDARATSNTQPNEAAGELKVNAHVTRLRRHLPLGPNARELYEEHRDPAERDKQSIPTRAGTFVAELLATNTQVSLVILTGDAGHGKTHLCTNLLIQLCGLSSSQALEAMRTDPRGSRPHPQKNGRPLRIVKDLSELAPVSDAATLLADLVEDESTVAVVCANEGRLRAVIDHLPDRLSSIRAALDASVTEGATTCSDVRVHIVNLNYQSVTSGPTPFFSQLLQKWVDDGRSWAVCRTCAAHPTCPILANRSFFASEGPHGPVPAERLSLLVRVVEQSGFVLTIREALMFLAYTIAGQESCETVHERFLRNRLEGGPTVFALLFEPALQPHELDQLKILERLRRLDPGQTALRAVDDGLLAHLDDESTSVAAELNGPPPRTRREAKTHQKLSRNRVKDARRRAFFLDASDLVKPWKRLGLLSYDLFDSVASGRIPDATTLKAIRNEVVRGLHVVQGIRPVSDADLYLIDPAFTQGRAGTSVIAARIPVKNVALEPQSQYWRAHTLSGRTAVAESVDWIDRKIVIRLGTSATDGLPLDMRQFEFLLRAAGGVAFRNFHSADMRRLSARLALVLRGRPQDMDRITVMDGHSPRSISIDVDNTFTVGEM